MNERAKSVTLRHLLTMTAGLFAAEVYDVDLGLEDLVGQIISEDFVGEPGFAFVYSDPGAHLGAVLRQAVDRPILDFAREKLFDPLGVEHPACLAGLGGRNRADTARVRLGRGRAGINLGSGGLKSTAPDMVKIGQLYLDEGRWQGRQWSHLNGSESDSTIDQLTKEQRSDGFRQPWANGPYGYFWWVGDTESHHYFGAVGLYGQNIHVVPDSRLILVTVSDERGFPAPTEKFYATLEDVIVKPILRA